MRPWPGSWTRSPVSSRPRSPRAAVWWPACTTSPVHRTRRAAREAGLTVTDRTLRAWLEGTRGSSKRNLERIETAYRKVRRHNVARYLLARLNREGRGTRVEYRTLNVRRWDGIVAAWAADDHEALDEAWVTHAVVDLGSQWGQYEYVTNIGFAA